MSCDMEYRGSIEFTGAISDLEKVYAIVDGLSSTRRVKRDMSLAPKLTEDTNGFGVEGEFYFGDDKTTIVNNNTPPGEQPSLYCGWMPNALGEIYWNYEERADTVDGWICYIVEHVIKANNCVANCDIEFRGADWDLWGTVVIKDNVVEVYDGPYKEEIASPLVAMTAIRYFNPSQLDDPSIVRAVSDMSSDDMGNWYCLLFYSTLNELVEEGVTEAVNQHDLDIITDLVSEVIGHEDDEAGTPKYPEIYMFSDHVATEEIGERNE